MQHLGGAPYSRLQAAQLIRRPPEGGNRTGMGQGSFGIQGAPKIPYRTPDHRMRWPSLRGDGVGVSRLQKGYRGGVWPQPRATRPSREGTPRAHATLGLLSSNGLHSRHTPPPQTPAGASPPPSPYSPKHIQSRFSWRQGARKTFNAHRGLTRTSSGNTACAVSGLRLASSSELFSQFRPLNRQGNGSF